MGDGIHSHSSLITHHVQPTTHAAEFFVCATARPLHHDSSSQAPRVRSSRFVRSPASGREAASATILIPGDHERGESRVSESGSHGPHAGETRDAETAETAEFTSVLSALHPIGALARVRGTARPDARRSEGFAPVRGDAHQYAVQGTRYRVQGTTTGRTVLSV